jgi:hypothetical protein
LARAQADLLRALVGAAPPPPGFDPLRIRVQADALVAKRREAVARLRPDLVAAAGGQFRSRFDDYALVNPRPAGGARADAEAFARTARRGSARNPIGRLLARVRRGARSAGA